MRPEPRLIEVRKNVLKQNDVMARSLRARFRAAGVFVAGVAHRPADVVTTVRDATGAALKAIHATVHR